MKTLDKKERKLEVESEGAMPSQNYDLSVKSPKIDPNDSEYSEDNDDPLSLSEIPTSQLDTSVQNSSDEDNKNVEEYSDENKIVDEEEDKEDTGSQSKKKKSLGTTGPVNNVKSKKPPKKKISDKSKKGSKEEIADGKNSSKLQKKKLDTKEETDEDITHSNDGEIDQ